MSEKTVTSDQQAGAPDRGIDFLLAEYAQINDERKRQREDGLHRLNFFITLTSSVLGGLVVVSGFGSLSGFQLRLIALGTLVFLIGVGWGTFLFSIARDISADRDIRAVARIRKYFVDANPDLLPYLTWQAHDEPTSYITGRHISNIRNTIQLILSVLTGLIVGILVTFLTLQLRFWLTIGLVSIPLA